MAPSVEEPIVCQPAINDTSKLIKPTTLPKALIATHPTRSLQFLKCLNQDAELERKLPIEAKVKLQVIIVGAGLGGLACAIALSRRGHKVTVLEQAAQLGEVKFPPSQPFLQWSSLPRAVSEANYLQVGAGIQIPSNSARLLHSWGLGPFLKPFVVEPNGMTFRRWDDGKAIGYTKLVPEFRDNFHAPYYVVHRAHFHDALHRRALELGVEVRVASRVVKYDLEVPSVAVENGDVLEADLVVAADGKISSSIPSTSNSPPERFQRALELISRFRSEIHS